MKLATRLFRSWLLAALATSALFGTPISSVTVFGDFQSEAGCSGDFVANCALTHMTLGSDGVWRLSLALPAGSYSYKVAINDSFAVNYGQNGVLSGLQIGLNLAAPTVVGFYFEPTIHNPTDNFNSLIVGATGSFQSELGCAADFDPICLRSWLQDPDGDGIYTYSTTGIPAGSYNFKFTLNESFAVNYGEGGVLNGPDIPLDLPANDLLTTFTFNASTHTGTVSTPSAIPEPSTALLLGAGLVVLMPLRRRANS